MIQIQHVCKKFGKLKALDNICTDLQAGEVVSLIGPNGSGKTTLIKSLLGMVIPDSGTMLFEGKNIAKDWEYRHHIGYMPQIGRYPDNMKIGQLFDMMKDVRRKQEKWDEELLAEFELEKMFQKSMHTLSGGTRQKVSACLAFLFNPKVLVLDEPTAGLDPIAAELLKAKILKEKEKGKLILLTSHILSDLDELSTEIMYLMDGNLCFHKSIEALKTETKEEKLGKAIAKVMLNSNPNSAYSKPSYR